MSTTSGSLADGTVHETRALGAQVLRWQPGGHDPVLFTGSRLPDVHPAHMGVPVVLPWFANGPDGDRTPSHGYGRRAVWTRDHESTTAEGGLEVRYRLDHQTASGTDGFDPRSGVLDAELTAVLGRTLDIALTVTNAGSSDAVVELLLHTYLRVGEVEQVRLTGLEGASYLDRSTPTPVRRDATHEPLVVRGEVDRVYASAGVVRVHDPVLGRVVTVSQLGGGRTVVWNPGEVKGEAFDDLAPGEWRGFVCVEAAAVLDRAVPLAPGASHRLSTRLEVDRLQQED